MSAETIVPAAEGWRLCVDTDGDSIPRRPFCSIDIIAWAIAADGTATPITPFGRANTTEAVIGQPSCNAFSAYVVMPSGPILRDHGEVERWFQLKRRRAVA